MSRNALDVAKEALRLWRANHGNASLDQQCQRYDGYYWQWAYQGNENIRTYGTATAASNASTMYSTNINDANAAPGDIANWYWNPEGHVGTVIGHDNGRVLVTHTSSKGDTVLSLTNHVKVSHADTIGLTFRGYSKTNGANAQRSGLSAWNGNGGGGGGGGSWAFNQPDAAIQARIQQALKNRGRYSGPVDGVWGPNTIKGIQTTIKNVGYDGPIDGVPGKNTCHFVQVYAQRFGDYAGPIDSILGPNSWAGFALGLERP